MRAREFILESINGNYLYHSTEDAATAHKILDSGVFKAGNSKQDAADAQTNLPVVSFGRNLNYQLNGGDVGRDYQVVFVVDRSKLESNYKTLSTSQSPMVKGLAFAPKQSAAKVANATAYDVDHNRNLTSADVDSIFQLLQKDSSAKIGQIGWVLDGTGGRRAPTRQEISNIVSPAASYFKSKSGKEYEEIVPTKTGTIPWNNILVGFYLVPGKEAANDPTLINHPLRLDMPRPNTFVKTTPELIKEANDIMNEYDHLYFSNPIWVKSILRTAQENNYFSDDVLGDVDAIIDTLDTLYASRNISFEFAAGRDANVGSGKYKDTLSQKLGLTGAEFVGLNADPEFIVYVSKNIAKVTDFSAESEFGERLYELLHHEYIHRWRATMQGELGGSPEDDAEYYADPHEVEAIASEIENQFLRIEPNVQKLISMIQNKDKQLLKSPRWKLYVDSYNDDPTYFATAYKNMVSEITSRLLSPSITNQRKIR